jgi:hypothetical protein
MKKNDNFRMKLTSGTFCALFILLFLIVPISLSAKEIESKSLNNANLAPSACQTDACYLYNNFLGSNFINSYYQSITARDASLGTSGVGSNANEERTSGCLHLLKYFNSKSCSIRFEKEKCKAYDTTKLSQFEKLYPQTLELNRNASLGNYTNENQPTIASQNSTKEKRVEVVIHQAWSKELHFMRFDDECVGAISRIYTNIDKISIEAFENNPKFPQF